MKLFNFAKRTKVGLRPIYYLFSLVSVLFLGSVYLLGSILYMASI